MTSLTLYKRYIRRRRFFIAYVAVMLVAALVWALLTGATGIGLTDILALPTGKGSALAARVLLNIRLPRIVGALLAGAALAVAGAIVQSLLRNPLASPFTLGISGAAAFGAAFAIMVLGAGSAYSGSNDMAMIDNPYLLTLSAFTFSMGGVAVILLLSERKGATPEMIILSGIVISSLFSAGIAAMQYFADSVQLASIVFWTFGDLGRASWDNLWILAVIIVPTVIFAFRQRWAYKAMQAGDEYAKSLGVNVKRVRLSGMLAAALMTSTVVSFYGVIAFVGLVVPHIIRRIIGGDERFLIPAATVFGGFFLLLSDTLARSVIAPVLLPVGILTSLVGAPLFLILLISGMKRL